MAKSLSGKEIINDSVLQLDNSYQNGGLPRRRRRRAMRNPYFPMYQQPKEEVVPVYAVVSTETPSSSSSNYGVSLFEWQSPSQGGYRIANIGSVAVGQLQGFVGVGTGAVVAGTGVVAGASIATAGTGAAALTAAFGMGCATIGNEIGGLCVEASAGAVLCLFASFPGTVSALTVVGVAVMGAGAGCLLTLGTGFLGGEMLDFAEQLFHVSVKQGVTVASGSCQTGLAISTAGLRSIGNSSYYALSSLTLASIQAVLATTQLLHLSSNKPVGPTQKIEYQHSVKEVEGQEFVVLDRKPTLSASGFLEDCVGIEGGEEIDGGEGLDTAAEWEGKEKGKEKEEGTTGGMDETEEDEWVVV